MFRGCIEPSRTAGSRRWRLVALENMQHPLLESFSWENSALTVHLCRERCLVGSAQEHGSIPREEASVMELRDFMRRMQSWPLDWQAIIFDHRAASIEFSAGNGGVAPLYIRSKSGQIQLSWDIADFYAGASLADIDRDWLAFRLTGNPPYAASTLFANLYMLTERARIHVDAKAYVRVDYPDPATYFMPTTLRDNVNIPEVAADLLEGVLARWPLADHVTVTEFSGGMDSAVIAGVLARMSNSPPLTAALQIMGTAASQQTQRRQMAIRKFGFLDEFLSVQCRSMIPANLSADGDYIATPHNADLQRPLRHLLHTLRAKHQASVIATGTGGDELLMLHAFEQGPAQWERNVSDAYLPKAVSTAISAHYRKQFPDYVIYCDRAPFPILPISVLEAQAARAPLFARYALWPVSALAQPEAVRFYRSLPKEWRMGKRLHRELLRHLGYPEDFLNVPLRENFEPYLQTSLTSVSQALASDIRGECRLHDLGIVDADALADALQAIGSSSSLDDIGFVFHALNMEAILRRIGSQTANANCLLPTQDASEIGAGTKVLP